MATIKASEVDSLKKQIDDVTNDPTGIPGTVYCAVNAKGELIFQHASGNRGLGKQEPMTMDSVFWIARSVLLSNTKETDSWKRNTTH